MSINVEIISIPIGSILTSAIGTDDPDDQNDFRVRILLDGNGTGLTEDGITLSTGASLVEITGSKSVWEATVRPPVTAGTLTFTVNADAFTEGNAETDLDIRLSTSFPDDDAEVPTLLFETPDAVSTYDRYWGIAVTPTRILLGRIRRPVTSYLFEITEFQHDGTEIRSLPQRHIDANQVTLNGIDVINGDILASLLIHSGSVRRFYRFDGSDLSTQFNISSDGDTITHTRLGYTSFRDRIFNILPYGSESATDLTEIDVTETFPSGYDRMTHQDDLLFFFDRNGGGGLAEIIDANTISFVRRLNIKVSLSGIDTFADLAIYQDTLYFVSPDVTDGDVFTLDARPYRPTARNTKTTIYPVFANEGDTIPLKQFCPDAHTITFGIDFDKPDYLSINADNELEITSNAVTETQPVLVKLTGINYIDSIEFQFYLIIVAASAPTWRDVDSLSMKANTTYDLHQIVDADSIAFESGETQPTDSSISNGIFTIGTTAGTARFTATKGSLTTDKAIAIDVVQAPDPDNFSDITRFKVEIAGIDVTADLLPEPPIRVSKSLDSVDLTQYRADSVSVALKNNEGTYNPDLADNFWAANNLNAGGYQEEIKIYRESFVNGSWLSTLLFVGIVENQGERFSAAQVNITARDISVELERSFISDFGTLLKWGSLRQQSDEATYEGAYVPEGSLTPIQPKSGKAWSDRTPLTLRQLQNPSKGPPLVNTGYLTAADFRTSGGFLENPPLLNFKAVPRSEDVRFLINQSALESAVYNTDIQLIDVELDDPTVFNRGSVPFSVEDTRITRLITDWVHDATNDRLLMPLSNPEGHIADLLVQYTVESDSYRVLHTFDKGISVHRIARNTSTDYYILSAKAITQDRSASALPRAIDSTGYAYDSLAEESEIKILRYNASTDTLTEHVDETDDRPPQLGIHYHVGFEKALYIDEFEGIVADYRGAFKWYSGNLYYRYATLSEFGVARVNTGGTTTEMIDQAELNYNNHLNFAFDVTSGGDIYFVYATGDTETSTLVIKRRTSGGTESTILSETRGIGDFNELGLDFGAFLGCYEALFHNNNLFILTPIQKANLGDDTQSIVNPDVNIEQLTAEKSGERNVTTSTNLNPTSLILAPGDDIPLRIDFNGTVTGATQSDLTVYGGTIQSFSISSDMIDVTIRPESKLHHKTILVDLAEDAVDETNEAWRITIDFETVRSRSKASGMALYRCDVTAGSPSLTLIEKYDFATHGACNLVIHENNVHFIEQPAAASQFKPINPDLDTYNENLKYNILPEAIGALKKIDTNGDPVESLGNLWYDERPYNIAGARALSFDDELHVMMGYGNPDELLRYNSLASKADNFVHLVFGNKLNYILPIFSTDGNLYDKLSTLARQVGATLRFDGNIISVVGRRAFRAKTDGATGTGTGDLDFDGSHKTFPSTGYLRIGDEFIGYTGISSGAFTGITRGALGSEIVGHADNADILYLNALLSERDILNINGQTDTTRHANIIRDDENLFEVKDDANIAQYRKQPYTLDLGLTRNEDAWTETLFAEYLSELKNLGKVFDVRLRPRKKSFALDLGQWIGVKYGTLTYALRIEMLTYHSNIVEIKGRSVKA